MHGNYDHFYQIADSIKTCMYNYIYIYIYIYRQDSLSKWYLKGVGILFIVVGFVGVQPHLNSATNIPTYIKIGIL